MSSAVDGQPTRTADGTSQADAGTVSEFDISGTSQTHTGMVEPRQMKMIKMPTMLLRCVLRTSDTTCWVE